MIYRIVPHRDENTNFMPLFAEARVIPEHLQATYRKLLARFCALGRASRKRAKKRTHR